MGPVFQQYLLIFFQLLVSGAFGWLLGYERRKVGKPVGARTFSLIAMGSALFTITAIQYFPNIDTAGRVIANIVIGIGFLGAGVIWKHGNTVEGITTAALVWVCAAIGIAVGFGNYIIGLMGFALAMAFVLTRRFIH